MARRRPIAEEPSEQPMELIDVRRAYRDLRVIVAPGVFEADRWPSAADLQTMTVEEAIAVATRACAAYGYKFPPRVYGSRQGRRLGEPA